MRTEDGAALGEESRGRDVQAHDTMDSGLRRLRRAALWSAPRIGMGWDGIGARGWRG